MMKQFKNIISFLTIICCLSGSILPAYAAQRDPGVPTATFINESGNSPDLYVTKQVDSDYTVPEEDVFQLVLTDENDLPIEGQEYHVIDPVLGEITEWSGRYGTSGVPSTWVKGAKVTLVTDSNGVFKLRAGQTAWFQGFGVRKYKVKERDTYLKPTEEIDTSRACCDAQGNFQRVLYEYEEVPFSEGGYSYQDPSSGSTAVREVLATGSPVIFTNGYLPGGAGEKGELRVSKTIGFVDDDEVDYKVPDTPDFWFSLKIKGAPCVDEAYTIIGAKVGENSEGKTDKEGRFSLKGGQTAVFSQLPTTAYWEVSEILKDESQTTDSTSKKEMPAGWRPLGQTSWQSSTGNSGNRATFHNTNVSFGVKKSLTTGDTPNETFIFRLTDNLDYAMGGKTYLKYLTTGDPVYNTSADASSAAYTLNGKAIATGQTKDDGTFTLKPGEAAIFVGMGEGTKYKVKELGKVGYIQTQPLYPEDDSQDDYYTVSGSEDPQMIHYVNQPLDLRGNLIVNKTVQLNVPEDTSNTENPPAIEDSRAESEFHFVLYQELKTYGDVRKYFGYGKKDTLQKKDVDDKVAGALAKSDAVAVKETEAVSGDPADDNSEYLYTSDSENYRIYVAVKNTIYYTPDNLELPSGETGPNNAKGLQAGEFILSAERTAIFKELQADRRYLVREIKLTVDYKEVRVPGDEDKYVRIDIGLPEGDTQVEAQIASLSADDGAAFGFINEYDPHPIELLLHKTDGGGTTPLEDAEFMIYTTHGKEDPILPPVDATTGEQPTVYRTDSSGKVMIPNLREGTYWLYELRAPSGYCILKEPIRIEIRRTAPTAGQDSDLEVLLNGRSSDTAKDYNPMIGPVTIHKADSTSTDTKGQATVYTNDRIDLTVKNTDLYELPNSGGIGIYWYTIGGTLLMLAAILILYRNNRQRRC